MTEATPSGAPKEPVREKAFPEPTPKEGQNHWSRVVHDLEDSKALTQKYNEQAIYWDPDVPDAAEFFSTLKRDKQRLNALLRDIALRADPHALD